MRKYLLLASVVCVFSVSGQNAVGRYRTPGDVTAAFLANVRTIPNSGFTMKSSDKTQGTIQAVRLIRGQELGSVFILILEEGDGVLIEATFARNGGFFGGGKPADWAKKYGEKLKTLLPDLTIEVVEAGKE